MRKRKKESAGAPTRPNSKSRSNTSEPQQRAKPLRSDITELKGPAGPDPRVVLHELQVHQIELELQNEELRAARLDVEQALSRYTELFDFAPIGYASVNADAVLLDINHAGARLLGRMRSLLRGQRVQSIVSAASETHLRNLLVSAEIRPGRQTCELELLRADGHPFPALVSATVLRRAEPTVLLAFQDISESREREQKLEHTERALRDADRRKDEFLAVLSHELRNPLAPIRNSVFVLSRSEPGGEEARRAQAIIDRQVTHLTRLIDDLLDVTRIARGKIDLQLQPVELSALVQRTLDDHRASFDAMGIELQCRVAVSPIWVRADEARVVQIVSNVLTNSLKFTPRGGHVQLTLLQHDECCSLEIRDSGVGIAPEVLERVFEPFAQGPQTLDRSRGGLGLGLAMVKGLVELHGGRVQLASDGVGQGTRVTISLPLGAAPAREEEAAAPVSRRRRRVLVIEDNLDASDTLQVALTLHGHEVRTAPDGPHGLELASQFEPDVVICDIGLPGMDGYQVARAFRADRRLQDRFLVALSGYAQPEDQERSRRAGFNRHLAKPTNLDTLERLVSEARCETPPDPERATLTR